MAEAPQAELQKLVFDTLRLDSDVANTAGGVYDRVPTEPFKTKTAYISSGPSRHGQEWRRLVASGLHTFQIDVWSKAVGQVEARGLVRSRHDKSALHLREFDPN